jgi:hypothetical protein
LFFTLDSLDAFLLSHTRRGSETNTVIGRKKLVLSELDLVLQKYLLKRNSTKGAENNRRQRDDVTTSTPFFQSRLNTITLSRVAILKWKKIYLLLI